MPAEPGAVLRPLEALNSVMYSDLCRGALGVPDLDLEGDLDLDRLLQAKAPKVVKLKLRTVRALVPPRTHSNHCIARQCPTARQSVQGSVRLSK